MANDKILRCSLCTKRFSIEDVKEYRFFPETLTCFGCYQTLSKRDYSFTCFGKQNKVSDTGKVIKFGYDPGASVDCSMHCPHRKICRLFASKEIHQKQQDIAFEKKLPFRNKGTVIRQAFKMCLKGTTKKRLVNFIERKGKVSWRILRILKSGTDGKHHWRYEQVLKVIKIYLEME